MPLLPAGSEVTEVVSEQFDALELVLRLNPSVACLSGRFRHSYSEFALADHLNLTNSRDRIKFDEFAFSNRLTASLGPDDNFQFLCLVGSITVFIQLEALNGVATVRSSGLKGNLSVSSLIVWFDRFSHALKECGIRKRP